MRNYTTKIKITEEKMSKRKYFCEKCFKLILVSAYRASKGQGKAIMEDDTAAVEEHLSHIQDAVHIVPKLAKEYSDKANRLKKRYDEFKERFDEANPDIKNKDNQVRKQVLEQEQQKLEQDLRRVAWEILEQLGLSDYEKNLYLDRCFCKN